MSTTGRCESCQAVGPVCYGEYRRTIGMLVLSQTWVSAGWTCQRCAKSRFAKAMTITLLLGWWSAPGLIGTPVIAVRNVLSKRKQNRDFLSPSGPKSTDLLPWGRSIGIVRGPGVSQQQLTWPIAIGAISALAFLIFSIGVVGGLVFSNGPDRRERSDELHNVWLPGFVLSSVSLVGSILWHRRRNPRPGQIPDLLGELFPASVIYQSKCLQVAGVAVQVGSAARFIFATQNLRQLTAKFEFSIRCNGASCDFPSELDAGEVAAYCVHLALPADNPSGSIYAVLSCLVLGGGRTFRHYARGALRSPARQELLMLGLSAGGHFHIEASQSASRMAFMSSLGEFRLSVAPPSPSAAQQGPNGQWVKIPIGKMQDVSKLEEAVTQLKQLLSGTAP